MEYLAHINKNGDKQSCREHSVNTAQRAAESLKEVGLDNTGYLAGLCHDVGKYSSVFQEYLAKVINGESVQRGSVIHSFAGVKLIMENFHPKYSANQKVGGWESTTSEIISTAIGCHHGLFDELSESGASALDYRCNKQPQYDEEAIATFLAEETIENISSMFSIANKEVEQVALACVKLANQNSNEERQNDCFFFYLGLVQRLLNSAVMDGDRTDTAEFMQDIVYSSYTRIRSESTWDAALNHLESFIDEFPTDTVIQRARREMSDLCAEAGLKDGGVYRLNIPTGGGKTLSSLRYALKHAQKFNKKRIIITAPLLSVLDQNVDVVCNAVGMNDIVLVHHSDIAVDDFSSEELKRYEILTDTWDAPIVMTTFVQLLNTLFSGKTASVRRFHSLCNSVIVIDEVQNIPEKMISLFTLAINFLARICNTTIVLCSATQPGFECNTFNLLTDGDVIPDEKLERYRNIFRRTQISYRGELTITEIASRAKELSDERGNILVICNTKKEASTIFRELERAVVPCIYLSTSLCMAHRKAELRRLTDMLKNNEKVICVSTQLIEAGVDISFSSVIRLTAGIDNIAQAAGRCNRHGEQTSLAPVEVVSLKDEKLSFLKEIDEAKSFTQELIAEYRKEPARFDEDLISFPAISYFYKRKFHHLNKHLGKTEYPLENGQRILDLLSMNKNNINKEPWVMRQAFKTAGSSFEVFDNSRKSLIVPYDDDAISVIEELYNVEQTYFMKSILDRAKPYTVQVFEYQYNKLRESGAIIEIGEEAIAVLQEGYYDNKLGVIDPCEVDINQIDESYIL